MLPETNATNDYQEWVANLPERETRALAHQVGISGWVTYPSTKLRSYLMGNKDAYNIYVAVYKPMPFGIPSEVLE